MRHYQKGERGRGGEGSEGEGSELKSFWFKYKFLHCYRNRGISIKKIRIIYVNSYYKYFMLLGFREIFKFWNEVFNPQLYKLSCCLCLYWIETCRLLHIDGSQLFSLYHLLKKLALTLILVECFGGIIPYIHIENI